MRAVPDVQADRVQIAAIVFGRIDIACLRRQIGQAYRRQGLEQGRKRVRRSVVDIEAVFAPMHDRNALGHFRQQHRRQDMFDIAPQAVAPAFYHQTPAAARHRFGARQSGAQRPQFGFDRRIRACRMPGQQAIFQSMTRNQGSQEAAYYLSLLAYFDNVRAKIDALPEGGGAPRPLVMNVIVWGAR